MVVHSQMRKMKHKVSEIWDDGESDASNKTGQYTQIPAITKPLDAMRANTSEERLKYSGVSLPSKASFAAVQSELGRITEVPHENCSSPCKECRDRSSTEDSTKSKENNSQIVREGSDISEINITQEITQKQAAEVNTNNNAKSTETKGKPPKIPPKDHVKSSVKVRGKPPTMSNNSTKQTENPAEKLTNVPSNDILKVEDLENVQTVPTVIEPTPSTSNNQPSKLERRSSLKKPRGSEGAISTRRVSVQFQLYPEEHAITPPEEPKQDSKASKRRNKQSVVLDDETTTSEAVTTETWLSGSSATHQKPARQSSGEHTHVWASRHFNSTQDFSFSSGTPPRMSLADSTGSGQTWNEILKRRRRSIQRIRENKAVKMTVVVVGAFLICWLPFEVTFLVKQFCSDCVNETAWLAVTMTAYSASAINPFIYNFYSSEFRRAAKRALCCDDNVVTPWM